MGFPVSLAKNGQKCPSKLGICNKIAKNVFHMWPRLKSIRYSCWILRNMWQNHYSNIFVLSDFIITCYISFLVHRSWIPCDIVAEHFRICNGIVIVIFRCPWYKMNIIHIISVSPRMKSMQYSCWVLRDIYITNRPAWHYRNMLHILSSWFTQAEVYCLVSNREGLGTSL